LRKDKMKKNGRKKERIIIDPSAGHILKTPSQAISDTFIGCPTSDLQNPWEETTLISHETIDDTHTFVPLSDSSWCPMPVTSPTPNQ
jgi:hypothetical protein